MYHLLYGRRAISSDTSLCATLLRSHLALVAEPHDPRLCDSVALLTIFSSGRTVTHSYSMIICMKHL